MVRVHCNIAVHTPYIRIVGTIEHSSGTVPTLQLHMVLGGDEVYSRWEVNQSGDSVTQFPWSCQVRVEDLLVMQIFWNTHVPVSKRPTNLLVHWLKLLLRSVLSVQSDRGLWCFMATRTVLQLGWCPSFPDASLLFCNLPSLSLDA